MSSPDDVATDDRPILIAFDGSDYARAAAAEAARLFPSRRAVVVAGWRSVESAVPASLVALPAGVAKEAQIKMDAATENDAFDRAETGAAIFRESGGEAEASAVKAGGSMWQALIACADHHDAAAVVVGSRGLSGIKSALLGSVSTGLAHHCDRPVLVVHGPTPRSNP